MEVIYKKLILNPRCLQPARTTNDKYVYVDALAAINQALAHPHITESEKNILEGVKLEVLKNRFDV